MNVLRINHRLCRLKSDLQGNQSLALRPRVARKRNSAFTGQVWTRRVLAAQGDESQLQSSARQFVVGSRQTRLSTRITTLPRRVDLYFAGNLLRQALWSFIAFGIGFYSANTVSLSFGALAINDVVAAAITVAFCEVCSRAYYSAPRATLKLVLLNAFKMGVVSALVSDAFKLGG